MLLWPVLYEYLYGWLLAILVGIYLAVWSLDHKIIPCLPFGGTTNEFWRRVLEKSVAVVLWFFAIIWDESSYCTYHKTRVHPAFFYHLCGIFLSMRIFEINCRSVSMFDPNLIQLSWHWMPREAFFRLQAAFLCSRQFDCGLISRQGDCEVGDHVYKDKNLSRLFLGIWSLHGPAPLGDYGKLSMRKTWTLWPDFQSLCPTLSSILAFPAKGRAAFSSVQFAPEGLALWEVSRCPWTWPTTGSLWAVVLWLFKAFLRSCYHRNYTGISRGSRLSQKARRLEERPTILLLHLILSCSFRTVYPSAL